VRRSSPTFLDEWHAWLASYPGQVSRREQHVKDANAGVNVRSCLFFLCWKWSEPIDGAVSIYTGSMVRRAMALGMLCALSGACSSKSAEGPHRDVPRVDAGADAAATDPTWSPGVVQLSSHGARRGMIDLRGLIHEHSVYSHDACDGTPRDPTTDAIDQQCFDDFRVGMCAAAHDYIMLSDHGDSFSRTEYPDTLLYRPDLGDVLVERGGSPVANRAACPAGGGTMILAGTETGFMPVGLEHHAAADPTSRQTLYGDRSAAAIAAFKAAGGVVLVAHTEGYDGDSQSIGTPDDLVTLPLDGFEMYNLHANLTLNLSKAVSLLGQISQPDQLMQSDLVIMQVFSEDPRYLQTWGTVLARGARRVTTMGTDAHRNSLPMKLPDGDRIDSYSRMDRWFSNHLLVRPAADGSWDDLSLKDALRSGRLYGAFEFLGYPSGFDFRAEEPNAVREMGEETAIASGAELVASVPTLRGLDPAADAPEITLKLLYAIEGGWEEITSSPSEIRWKPTKAGAYRVEVRMVPHHLSSYLHSYADFATKDTVWVYSNPIYVVD
jgi:hypothetical protein